jgi:tRNA threonylcarbamoyladenosine biosynthesis protein TsaB
VEIRNLKPETRNLIYLGLDTATPFLSLALWSSQKGLLAHFAENIGRDHAKRIMLEIDTLFKVAHVSPSQLAGIGVGVGPGSYTGVRVGIATAKALAKGLGVPLVSVNTLAAMAFAAMQENETGMVALDARKGSVYASVFERREDEVQGHTPIQKILVTTLQEQHPTLTYHQDVCPDASYIARRALTGNTLPVEAIYL